MPEAVSKETTMTNENTETPQESQPVEQQQNNTQTEQQEDNTQPEQQQDSIPTDEQVIECVEAIITKQTKKASAKPERKKVVKPKVVSLAEGQELHIKLPDGVKTCAIQCI